MTLFTRSATDKVLTSQLGTAIADCGIGVEAFLLSSDSDLVEGQTRDLFDRLILQQKGNLLADISIGGDAAFLDSFVEFGDRRKNTDLILIGDTNVTIIPTLVFIVQLTNLLAGSGGQTAHEISQPSKPFYMKDEGQSLHEANQDSVPVYLRDKRIIELLKEIVDPILLLSARRQINEFGKIDSLLLASIIDASRGKIKLIIDGLFLDEFRLANISSRKVEHLFLDDTRASDLDKQKSEGVFITDTTDRFNVRGVQLTDNLFINEFKQKELEKQILDLLLLGDELVRGKIRVVTDGLFLNDERSSEVEKQVLDLLFLDDVRKSELEKKILDLLLLGDSTGLISSQIVLLLINEGLFLDTARRSELEKKILDLLLLGDSSSIIAKQLTLLLINEGLFLDETPIKEILSSIVDGLFLDEIRSGEVEKEILDLVLLGSSDIRAALKITIDDLFLSDTRSNELEKQILDLLFLDEETLRAKIRVVVDGLFIKEDKYSDLKKLLVDGAFLTDTITSLVTAGPGGEFNELVITDILVMFEIASREEQKLGELLYLGDELREKTQARKYDDTLLLNTILFKLLEKAVLEGVLLKDNRLALINKLQLDKILLGEPLIDIAELRTRLASDGVFLNDFRISILELIKADGIFIKDSIAENLTTVLINEGLFLDDVRKSELEKKILDLLLLGDSTAIGVEKIVLLLIDEGLFLDDPRKNELEKKILDLLLLGDSTDLISKQLILLLVTDGLFLDGARKSEIKKKILDLLLLGDPSSTIVSQIVLLLINEGLFLDDTRKSNLEKKILDFLLLGDSSFTIARHLFEQLIRDNVLLKELITKEAELIQIDTILIKSIFTDIIELIAQDDVLLKDDKFSVVEKNFIAFLLVSDAAFKEIQHIEGDSLLLKDNVNQLLIELQLAVDSLFLSSTDLRDQLHNFTDNVIFKDVIAEFRSEKTFTDNLLFRDERLSELELFQQNQVLFKELIEATRAVDAFDGLFLADETTRLLIRLTGTLLVFAQLGAKDLLGIRTKLVDDNFLLLNDLFLFNPSFLKTTLGARVANFFGKFSGTKAGLSGRKR